MTIDTDCIDISSMNCGDQLSTTAYPSPVDKDLFYSRSHDEKIAAISSHFAEIMKVLGLDLQDPSLCDTPQRVARMYVDEVFSGLDPGNFPSITLFPKHKALDDPDEIVIVKSRFTSFCEHHFVPMTGTAVVGYIPNKNVIGLSKISRLVRYFASRPQLQERLSEQIGSVLSTILGHDNVAVFIKAKHYCVVARGIKDESATTTTLYTTGCFQALPEKKCEFLHLVNIALSQNSDGASSEENEA